MGVEFSKDNNFCKEEINKMIAYLRRKAENQQVPSPESFDYLEAAIQSLIKNYEASDR